LSDQENKQRNEQTNEPTNEQENETTNEQKNETQQPETDEAAQNQDAAPQEAPEPDDAQTLLAKAQEELKQQKDRFLRTAAEYDNYRKRTEREKSMLYLDATAATVAEFLPVADNLERALAQPDCSVEDLRKGVEMVLTQMQNALKKLGVTEMGAEGEPFNPDLHNAVSHIEDENVGENTITQVFQKGYKIEDRVIRHAMVQVAN